MLDLLDNFALPLQFEKLQKGISAQTAKVRRSRDAFKSKSQGARDRMVEEWRRRVPSARGTTGPLPEEHEAEHQFAPAGATPR